MSSTAPSLKTKISLWLDSVSACSSTGTPKKKRLHSTDIDLGTPFNEDVNAGDEFPPQKRARNILEDSPHFPPTTSSIENDSTSSFQSHNSGKYSPVRQIRILEDSDRPVIFVDFYNMERVGQAPESVTHMHTAAQITDAFKASIAHLPKLDQMRLQYPSAKDAGRNPSISNPPTLISNKKLPSRIIDYAIRLQPDSTIKTAYQSLQPLTEETVKSWDHITTVAQKMPITINIETKGPMKSWTDGKAQVGIWMDAWLHGCELLCKKGPDKDWPAIPVLISQGHEWHLLIVTKNKEGLTFREMIMIGSTRNCFDTLKVVAVLQWLMDWAETVWRPWFLSLIAQDDA
ncbi:hypothetical protein L13192_02652 [Pyrenophora tritici-repentis]|nr:hypothetical protein L13192_02652 [Pyrenophora tritici-repentis]KAI1686910.1 hypothetical protein KJE20_00087 [Pyrenophora tritici-repentis]PZC91395.1 hypothetical protein A1F95_08800 [Pyrenophora tritici-repentis]